MEDFKKRRTRGPNFSNDEKILLLRLVDKYKDILECKRTDGITWRDKKDTWTKVAREFNASTYSSERRTPENIKTCYENLKKCTKKMALTTKGIKSCNCNGKYDPVFELTWSILNKTMMLRGEDKDILEENGHDNFSEEIEQGIKAEEDYYSTSDQEQFVQEQDDYVNESEENFSQQSENHQHYEDLTSLKAEVYKQQLLMLKKEEESKEKQRRREELEFEVEKRRREKKWELEQKALLLDIKIKEAQLQNVNLNLNLM